MSNSIIKSIAKKSGKSVPEIKIFWDKALLLAKKKLPTSSPGFFAYVAGIVKKMSINESEVEFKVKGNEILYKFAGKWIANQKAVFLFKKQFNMPAAFTKSDMISAAKKHKLVTIEAYDDLNTPHRMRQEPKNSSSKIFKRDQYLRDRVKRDKKRTKQVTKIDKALSEIKNKLNP